MKNDEYLLKNEKSKLLPPYNKIIKDNDNSLSFMF